MPPTERPDTSPEGVDPVDPGVEELSRDGLVELADVRRGACGGVAFSAACAAATLDATDMGFSSSSVSSGPSFGACKAHCQRVAWSALYGKMMGYIKRLKRILFSPRQV